MFFNLNGTIVYIKIMGFKNGNELQTIFYDVNRWT